MSQKVLAPGALLGRYELLAPLASGSFATVWAARLRGLGGFQKIVAVKVMSAKVGEDIESEKMFLDEAKLASRVEHPNVVETLDVGEHAGFLYQAMEFVDGEPVASLLGLPALLPLVLVLNLGMQACRGLHAAHELRDERGKPLGLVHRDVSPQNLIVTYEGVVKLVDFGIAKAACNAHQTTFGNLKGKPTCMSPEQALGRPVDRTTDVFALAIVLYRLSTGKHPFAAGGGIATMLRICREEPPRPRALRPSLPQALEDVLLCALAKDRARRFQTMLDFAAALESVEPASCGRADRLASFMRAHFGRVRSVRLDAIQEALKRAEAAEGAARRGVQPAAESASVAPRASVVATTARPPRILASVLVAVGLGVGAAVAIEAAPVRAGASSAFARLGFKDAFLHPPPAPALNSIVLEDAGSSPKRPREPPAR